MGTKGLEHRIFSLNRNICNLFSFNIINFPSRANDNCFYILNEKNVLMCFKWLEEEKKWKDLVLARYYGCTRSIADIHIYEGDIYLMLKTGTVFLLDRKGRNFEPLSRLMTLEQYRLMQYTMLLRANKIELAIPNVCDLKIPPYCGGNGVLFHKFSAIVGGK